MENIVPVLGIIFLFGAPVAAWIVSRVLAHQERMEMIRRGYMPPPTSTEAWSMKQASKAGWRASAPMPPPSMSRMPNMPYEQQMYAQHQLRKGITVTCVGFALLIGLSFIDVGTPGPWLLGGLIPMFVGIAQIISAVMGGARFTFPAPGPGPSDSANFGPSSTNTQYDNTGAPPPPPGSGPYAWRPGNTPEIEKPVPPPDHR
jgi:hypothetical protein